MIAITYDGGYTSCYKEKRENIEESLARLISTQGPKLEPITYATVKHFARRDRMHEIYRVSDLDTVFSKELNKVGGDVIYFAGWMGGSGLNRVRKLALISPVKGSTYLVYQESMDFTSRITVLNVKTLECVKVKSAAEAAGYLKALTCGLEALPLLLNTKGGKLRKYIMGRLNGS